MKLEIPEGVVARLVLRRFALGRDQKRESRRRRCAVASRCEQIASRPPISARLPMNGTPKRTPSSSENPITSMANGSVRPSKMLDQRHSEHDAQNAVERSGVRNGVQMRADEQTRRGGSRGRVKAAHIARVIDGTLMPACSIQSRRCACTCALAETRTCGDEAWLLARFGEQPASARLSVSNAITIPGTCCSRTGSAGAAHDSCAIALGHSEADDHVDPETADREVRRQRARK